MRCNPLSAPYGRPFSPSTILVVLACCLGLTVDAATAADKSHPLAIVGSVQDSEGQVVVGARVQIEPMTSGHRDGALVLGHAPAPAPLEVVSTDARGLFRGLVDHPGVYRLRIESEGMVPAIYLPLVITENRTVPPVVLQPAETVLVRVTDDRQRPVSGAWVFVENAEGGVWGQNLARGWMPDFRRQPTDDNGRVSLVRAQGETLYLRAAHPQLGLSPLDVPSPDTDTTQLILRPSPPQPARVHLLSGAPQPDILARLGRAAWPIALSDDHGTMSLPLPSSETDLWLMSADGRQLKHTLAPQASAAPLPLVFPSVAPIDGSVIDAATGEPLAGAVIWSGASPATAVRTDATGAYRIVAPSTGRFWLQAEAPGRRPQRQWVDSGNPSPAFRLHPGVSISGRVVDELGRTVDHASLEARPLGKTNDHPYYPGRFEVSELGGADGGYTLGGLEPGAWYEVRVSRPGFHPLSVRMGAPRKPTATTYVEVQLTSSRQAFGWVVDLEERPIANAEVVLTRADRGTLPLPTRERLPGFETDKQAPAGERRARTDEDGRFELKAVHGRAVDLTVYAPGFARTRVRDLLLEDESSTDLGTILMAEGVSIEGRVTVEDGSPAGGVSIFADLERQAAAFGDAGERAALQPDTTTDSDGRFRVSGFNPDDRVEVLALSPGYVPARQRGVPAPSGSPVELQLERAVRLLVTVRDAENRPLPGATIRVASVKPLAGSEDRLELGQRTDHQAVGDSHGRAELTVSPGRLELSAASGPWIRPEPLLVEARAGEEIEVDLALEAGRVLFGWVVDSQGRPITNAEVLADGLSKAAEISARSDEEGFFELLGLPGGGFQLTATHPGFVSARRLVEPDQERDGLELVLEEGLHVTGRVVDDREVGAAGVLVDLIGDGFHGPAHHTARSAADGTFQIQSVEPGRYLLQVAHPEFGEAEEDRWIEVAPGLRELRVVLERSFTVSGRVLGLDFEELTTVEVTATSGDRRPLAGRVDYSGRFFVEGLGSGAWLLEASLPDGQRQTQARVWLDGSVDEIHQDLEFAPGLSLQGTVTSSGRPLDDTRVSLSGLDADVQRAVVTDHLGHYRFDDLAPGRYRLGAMHIPEMLVSNRRIDLQSDRRLDLELEASRVSGRVVDAASGEGLSAASLVLRRQRTDESAQEFVITDAARADGGFSFPRVPPGTYRLEVRSDGFRSAEQTVEVTAGQDVSGLEAALDRAPGVRFRVRLPSGQIPAQIYAAELDPAGSPRAPQSTRPDSEGRVHLSTLSGETPIWVGGPGAALTRFDPRATANGAAPAEPLLVLEPGSRLILRIPGLMSNDGWASLELRDAGGQSLNTLQSAGGFNSSWSFAGGIAEIPGIPMGSWTVSVTTPDGRRLDRSVQVSGPRTEVVFQ